MKVLIALLMAGLSYDAAASDWAFFGMANNKGTVIDIDMASIVYGPITKVWVRYTFNIASGNKSAGDVILERNEFNCATHEVKWVESVIHAKFSGDSSEKGDGSWEPVAPDSINDAILTTVCKPRAAKKP